MRFTVMYRTDAAIERDPLGTRLGRELDPCDYSVFPPLLAEVEARDLEDVFRKMNVVDGDELPTKLGMRSMMTGDVAIDEDKVTWLCGMVGWVKVTFATG